ncbi:Cof-type HAD-IIB family hydrolase [Alkalihalobacillus sp. MEB130]|uniref:HAD family hydrolase n=1 Tax=Alkalihalobacillus sp. MEB130 TaxID=2976704 RepID=UPI0028DFB46F|nr:HAD family hydrolase [Alkalihalobacillus sp. MEB130]MDT8859733.1 Cof-type HAD-IIB family hydrolase [Alkalihalobacillus sp. MEB130]
MPSYKILFLDIDGTILRPDHTIEQSTIEAVSQVQEKGIEVFLATGRPLHEIREIGETLKINSFIGYNGAYAVHKNNDILKEKIEGEMIQYFLKTAEENGHEAILYTNKKNVLTSLDSEILTEFIEYFHLRHNVLYSSEFLHDILGVSLVNVGEKEQEKYEKWGGIHLSPVNVGGFKEHAYDVIRDKVNKGYAVEKVLQVLGISKEEAIAFGDGMNDKEMLAYVGEGFAMGNAQQELFAYAKHKTTDVTDSGIFNGLKSLGLIK